MRLAVLWVIVCCAIAAAADTDDRKAAAGAFASLFGRRVEQVAATPDAADDVALAREMVGAARTAKGQPALAKLLCEHAAKLGAGDPTGYDAAIEAMQQLITIEPAGAYEQLERISKLQQVKVDGSPGIRKGRAGEALAATLAAMAANRQAAGKPDEALVLYQRAEPLAEPKAQAEIRVRIARLTRVQTTQTEEKQLTERLTANPNDRDALRAMVRHFVVDLDKPAQALPWAQKLGDAPLLEQVTLAAGEADRLSDAQAMVLADAYRAYGEEADAPNRAAMLRRSIGYYRQFLSLHTDRDLGRTKADLAIKDLERRLAAAGDTAEKPNKLFEALRAPQDMRKGGSEPDAPRVGPPTGAGTFGVICKGMLQIYINGAKIFENKSGGEVRRIPVTLRPGDTVVLRVANDVVYRDVRFAYLDATGKAIVISRPTTVSLRSVDALDSALGSGTGDVAKVKKGRPDPHHKEMWEDQKLPADAEWIAVPDRKKVFDITFTVPGN